MKQYVVIFEPSPSGSWGAYVPDIPGCTSAGRTRDEAAVNVREAIEGHINVMREHCEAIPEPSSQAGVIAIDAA
ncbi:MAG: type II toxin-antitoxin system HicB family antitoxin [Vulcanimicrobiaceae bacterium]